MKERMRGKMDNKEVKSKVVEEAEGKQGGCHVTRTETEYKSNLEEVLSSSVRAQVPFHLFNIIKYLIYFQFVRYMKIEISHIILIHEIFVIFHVYFKHEIISPRYQIV